VRLLVPHTGGNKGPYTVFAISLGPRSVSKSLPVFPVFPSNGQQTIGSVPSKPQTEERRKLPTAGF